MNPNKEGFFHFGKQHSADCVCVYCAAMAVNNYEKSDGANLNDDQAYCELEADEWEE